MSRYKIDSEWFGSSKGDVTFHIEAKTKEEAITKARTNLAQGDYSSAKDVVEIDWAFASVIEVEE